MGSRAEMLAHQVQDQAKPALDEATDEADTLVRRAGEVRSQLGHSAETLAHDARDVAGRWEGTFERTLRENPLPVGAIALALGVAAGLAIPSTRIEDEWVGEFRDKAIDEVEGLAEQALGTVETGAKKLVENVKPTDQHTS
jgi:hypothetical protein